MARRFPIWYFLVLFWVDWCVFSFFESFYLFYHVAYSFGFFVMFSWLSCLLQNCSAFLASGCWYVSCHLLSLVGRIYFRCFRMFCFVCVVLPFLDIFLIFLLSPKFSGLFPQVVLLFFSGAAFSFSSQHVPAIFLYFIVFAFFVAFLSAFPVKFPIQVLIFLRAL